MKKKKRVFVLKVISIIIGFSLLGIIVYNNLSSYANVLKANWNIKLPKTLIKEIFNAREGQSFHGDGIRYHIFFYKEENENEINQLFDWTTEEKETIYYSSYSESVNNWLSEIKVFQENYPNYADCKYWYHRHDDNSEIIVIWNSKENRLYIAESFL